jgi:pantetheine-phosphate adenylyltransferase
MKTIGVVAGSFDPITVGHLWLIQEALTVVDKVLVLVASNPKKDYLFTSTARQELILRTISEARVPMVVGENILLDTLPENEFLVSYAKQQYGATHLIKGMRDTTDFLDEQKQYNLNRLIEPSVQTIFLVTPKEYSEVSSSVVKQLAPLIGSRKLLLSYVSSFVLKALESKLGEPIK